MTKKRKKTFIWCFVLIRIIKFQKRFACVFVGRVCGGACVHVSGGKHEARLIKNVNRLHKKKQKKTNYVCVFLPPSHPPTPPLHAVAPLISVMEGD